MDKNVTLFVLEHKLKDCSNLLEQDITKYFGENAVKPSDEDMDYANKIFSINERLKDILHILNNQ